MTIRTSLYFIFDGQKSTDFDLYNVNVSSGMLEEPFLATRQINEVKIRGRDKPYFTGITHSPLTFTLTFAFKNGFDSDKLRNVSRWLSPEYYRPLIFSDNFDRIYYAMMDSDSKLIHTGTEGYITITMRCDSPYSYSSEYLTPVYDFSTNPAGTTLQFNNIGDVSIFPEMWITKVGSTGSVSIANNSNGGATVTFNSGLVDTEQVYVDNQNEIIVSDQYPTVYRYGLHNNVFLELLYGTNTLVVTGNCKLQFRYELILLQG